MAVANAIPQKIEKLDDVLIPQKSTFLEGVKNMIEKMLGDESAKKSSDVQATLF